MNANAVVFPDKCVAEFRTISVPDPGPNDVVMDTHFSWISNGTEGSFFRCERINGETPYREGDPWPFPITPGYQSVGIVTHVGEQVDDIRVGQWVFGAIGRAKGMYDQGGGHISPKVMDRSQVWAIPDGLPPEAYSGLVLTQVGYNCGTRPPVRVGDTALVIGDGMVGHWSAQTLHLRGATVILAGRHDDRLAKWPEGGRRFRLNTKQEDLVARTREIAPDGIDVLVDTVGSVPTIMECHPLMRHNGHIVSAGFNGTESMLDVQRLRFGELTFYAPSGWQQQRMDDTLALIASGQLDTLGLVTHRFPVQQAADAWKLIEKRTEPVLGVILTWK